MSSQHDSASSQPKSQSSSAGSGLAEGNEELFENLLITLRSCTTVLFENIKITVFYNSNIRNAQEIANSLRIDVEESRPSRAISSSLRESSEASKISHGSNSLHAKVIAFFNKSFVSDVDKETFERDLQEALFNTKLVSTLREESFNMILPTITSWFSNVSTFKYGLVFLREGIRLFPHLFEKQANLVHFSKIVDALETLNEDDLKHLENFSIEEIQEVFNFLSSLLEISSQ
ncbi:hypothetical protein FDP41_003140 [Naegleria fowleri]|uniref:Uncharacterized protein n=1 Tax=Naegleria fowleri TaxID=5763 RepID=A0A6A5BV67_NAEFO|nr:uncharacterized protein FDP41_003140 [Naegleria fowleri]KAF0977818.1 hypothetical protein FDP41_003140 [Naegleria fowleri]